MARAMNEIEQRFYDSYCNFYKDGDLKPLVQVGPYVIDFVYKDRCAVEIDGHEFHKTKEQRFADYTRERYLMKNFFYVVRFMATEVFINPRQCVSEMLEIYATFGCWEIYMHKQYLKRELSTEQSQGAVT